MEPPLEPLMPLAMEPPLESLIKEPPLEGQRFCGVEDPPRGEVIFFQLSNISLLKKCSFPLLSYSFAVGANRAVPNSEDVRCDVH